jgi:hypothetical protein
MMNTIKQNNMQGEIKMKLNMCLIKYHAIKTYAGAEVGPMDPRIIRPVREEYD